MEKFKSDNFFMANAQAYLIITRHVIKPVGMKLFKLKIPNQMTKLLKCLLLFVRDSRGIG